jgi:hypothetical protein
MAAPHLSSSDADQAAADAPLAREPGAGEAEETPGALMTEPHLPSPKGARPASDSLVSLDQRKERLAETLHKKLEQGYQIESQTDTEAILITKGRRRWFGILAGGPETRQATSIDEQGRPTTRTL